MIDPVTLESGYTYERDEIKRYFKLTGNYDPHTKKGVNPAIMIPNLPIRQAT